MTLTLVHPRALLSLPTLPEGSRWLYADDDPEVYERIGRQYGGGRLVSPADFQSRAAELRAPFVQWLDQCLRDFSAVEWIPASYFKDIFSTPVFLHAVCISILDDVLRAHRSVVVLSSSGAFARQAGELARGYGLNVVTLGREFFSQDDQRIQRRAIRHYFLYPLRLLAATVLARIILGETYIKRLQGVEVLVDTFLLEGDIDADGSFHDRFLPGLLDYYRRQGIAAASAACTEALPFRLLRDAYRAMRNSETRFAPNELFLRIPDIFEGQRCAWRSEKNSPAFSNMPFVGLDIGHVASFWWKISVRRTVIARIYSAVGARMRTAGVAPQFFLDWCENQPIDKAMQMAFSRSDGATRTIAVRQYSPAENVLSFFPSTGEVARGVVPKENWVCGRRTAELFARHDALGVYRTVPALRYSHLYSSEVASRGGEDLVVFLTSAMGEALSILEIAFSDIDKTLATFRSVRIKTHQALQVNIPKLATGRWPQIQGKEVVWESASSSALLPSAALVLTAGSSVAVEAVCRGIPVVLTGRTAGLDVNPLEDIESPIWRVVYTPAEFNALVENWLPSLPPLMERQASGMEIRADYFEPVTEEGMQAFLPK